MDCLPGSEGISGVSAVAVQPAFFTDGQPMGMMVALLQPVRRWQDRLHIAMSTRYDVADFRDCVNGTV